MAAYIDGGTVVLSRFQDLFEKIESGRVNHRANICGSHKPILRLTHSGAKSELLRTFNNRVVHFIILAPMYNQAFDSDAILSSVLAGSGSVRACGLHTQNRLTRDHASRY